MFYIAVLSMYRKCIFIYFIMQKFLELPITAISIDSYDHLQFWTCWPFLGCAKLTSIKLLNRPLKTCGWLYDVIFFCLWYTMAVYNIVLLRAVTLPPYRTQGKRDIHQVDGSFESHCKGDEYIVSTAPYKTWPLPYMALMRCFKAVTINMSPP